MAKAKQKRRNPAAIILRSKMENVEAPGSLGAFERLARDKRLTVEKLGELIALQERILDRNARSAFEAAYRLMLPEIPRISKRGAIKNREGKTQSRYAKYEDIRSIVDPILLRHGFTFSTKTDWPATGVLEVVGTLTHAGGGTKESKFRTEADASGGKNAIQGLGSGVSYGKRYTLKDLLAIVEEGEDDDGVKFGEVVSSRRRDPEVQPVIDVHHAAAKDYITQPMKQRFQMILKNSGRNKSDVGAWIKRRYGYESSADITRDTYEEICKAIESPNVLPEREPGE